MAEKLLDCGHVASEHGPHTTGTARTPDGRTICYDCAHAVELADVQARRRICAYVAEDGRTITTWPGRPLMRVTGMAPCRLTRRSYTHSPESYQSYWARDTFGGNWYGRGSAGVLIRMRPVQ